MPHCIHGRAISHLSQDNEECLDCAELEELKRIETRIRNLPDHTRHSTNFIISMNLKIWLDNLDAIRTRRGPGAIGACTCRECPRDDCPNDPDPACPVHGIERKGGT